MILTAWLSLVVCFEGGHNLVYLHGIRAVFPGLNYFRFFLAVSVVFFHLNRVNFVQAGNIAVWCFFLISGYLVTRILDTTYAGRPGDFLVNRFLRIFPTYWAALLLGLILIYFFGSDIRKFHQAIYLRHEFSSVLENFLIFGLEGGSRIVPPAWSLAIELKWYLIIFCGSFLPKKWFFALLLANLASPFFIKFIFGQDFYVLGAGFAFALGAVGYHFNLPVRRMVSCVALVLVPVFMFVFPYCFGWDGHASTSLAASLNFLVVCVLVFLALPVLLVGRATGRISELLGNLSYPIFLTHWYAAYLCWSLLGLKRGTFTYALVSLLVSLCISYLIILLVENPIASIRQRYRLKRSV